MIGPTPVYDVGDSRRFSAQFTNIEGENQDPSEVTVQVRRPDDSIESFIYLEDANLIRSGTGLYSLDYVFSLKGRHQVQFFGTGDVVSAELIEVFIRG